MQRVSSDVLQELQHQGEGQAQQQSCTGGAESGGRGGVGSLTSSTSAPSLALTAADSPYAESSSPSTPFLGETFWQTREFAPETAGRGHGDVPDEWQLSPQGAWVRPGSGRGAAPTPPRSPAAETVPSQLLGGRAGSHADVLIEGPPESHEWSPSPAEYHIACKVATEVRLRNLLSPARPSQYVNERQDLWARRLRRVTDMAYRT